MSLKAREYIQKFLKGDIQIEIFDSNLIEALRNYDSKINKISKAWRIYWQCKRTGRIELANKIAAKYELLKADDVCEAFAISLLCRMK